MRNKYCWLSLIFFLATLVVKGQKVIWSAPLSEPSKFNYLKVIGQDENSFYLLRSNHPISNDNEFQIYRNTRFFVSSYNYEMRLLWEKAIDVEKKEVKIISFFIVDDKLAELSVEWNKQEKKFRLLSRQYNISGNADTFYKTIEEVEIASVESESSYFIATSMDKKSFLFAYQNQTSGSEQRYTTLVCDNTLKVIRKNVLQVPLSRKYFNPYRFLLSNEGNVFLFGIKTDSEKRNRDPAKNYFTLFSNTAESGKWNEHEIKNPEHFLNDAGVAIDELNHKTVVTGFYSDKTDYSIAGVFYYDINPVSFAVSEIRFSAFTPAFLYKFLGEQKVNFNRELLNYSIDKIILRKDGGAVIIAEANYTTEYSYYDYYLRIYLPRKYFHHDNIIQLSVNKDGTILWSNVIKKEQTSDDSDDSYISYTSVVSNGKIHCIFNRFLKRKTQVPINSTDALGSENNSPLFNDDQDVFIMPSASKQVDENMHVIPAYKGKELRLAGITF